MQRVFSERENLLLRAALCPAPDLAVASWTKWASLIELEAAPYPELRLLTSVYANLSRIAGDVRLPNKLKGKARATLIQNHLLARDVLPTIERLGGHFPTLISKGLAICVRFGIWSIRTMGDADVHIPFSCLPVAADLLRQMDWTPQYGMTWESLVNRSALRRSSWNLTRGKSSLDLHWRPQPETSSRDLVENMWQTSETHHCLGHEVTLQSPEYALASALAHGFKMGTHADGLQTVLDASRLLPVCRAKDLERVIDAFDLRDALKSVVESLEAAGVPPLTSPLGDLVKARPATQHREDASPAARPSALGFAAPMETQLLRNATLYRLWGATGRAPWIERLMLRWRGPFSRPIRSSAAIREDYDLRDCGILDQVGGPGWGWPESDGSCFWSDRADARLLFALPRKADYLLVLGVSERRIESQNSEIDVFANGHPLATMDFKRNSATSEYCFLVPRTILVGRWVELSFRPRHYRQHQKVLIDTYWLTRSVPLSRVRIYDLREANRMFDRQQASGLQLRVLSGAEPEATKFARIRDRIETSPYRDDQSLPEDFDPLLYVFAYRDLFDAEIDPYEHFLRFGRLEGRSWR
jgi:hypothetical protein